MKRIHIIGIVVIALAIGAILTTVADSSTYANFKTAIENPEKEFHVVGRVNKENPFEYNPEVNANLFSFYLKDNDGQERKINYNGTKPNDFERSEQIVIIGKMKGEEFAASGILMKCPSKYANPEEQRKELNQGAQAQK